jgi:LacI family transcriptional regulator
VVNEQPGVRDAVRRRVWKVVEETGYRPNLAARALASNRSGIVGLVIPLASTTLFTDPYFPQLTKGVTLACNDHDLSLTLFLSHSKEEEARLSRRIANASLFDGVIVASYQYDDPLIPHLIKNSVPLVLVGRVESYPQVSYVDVDNINGSYVATSHLLRLGYQRVAHIAGPQNMVHGVDRLAGYCKALADRGQAYREDLVFESDYSEAGGYMAMQRLLSAQPDAVFAGSDQMALGAWRALRDAGLRVPEDIAIVGFDDLEPSSTGRPRLTTIRQPVVRTGTEAVNILQDIIENGLLPPRRVVFDTELVIRESCGAAIAGR